MKSEIIENLLDRYKEDEDGLISILEEIQAKYSYLPREALQMVSKAKNIPMADIYGVATFYKAFTLEPRGKHLISCCLGTACHVRGAQAIAKEFENHLGVKPGHTTSDKEFTLETVNCLGACALGPVVVADGRYFSKVTKSKIRQIVDEVQAGLEDTELKQDYRIFPVTVSCPRCNHSLMDISYTIDGYPSIRVTVAFQNLHGWLRLSSLYGSFNVFSQYEIPPDTVANFFCPHCHSDITGNSECSKCGAPVVNMIVRGGGIVQVCSRRGCRGHMLDLNGSNI